MKESNVVEFVKGEMAKAIPSMRKCPLCGKDHRTYKKVMECFYIVKAVGHQGLLNKMLTYRMRRFL